MEMFHAMFLQPLVIPTSPLRNLAGRYLYDKNGMINTTCELYTINTIFTI